MALISKPDYTYIWSSGGSKISPTNTKIQTGWTAEVPPFQYENWIQNRQDQAIAHIFQRGIAQWDGLTNYEANVCYVTGSDGQVYKSVAASGPSTTIQDPVTDASDTYWKIAFAAPDGFLTETVANTKYLKISSNGSDVNNAVTFRTNIGAAALASPSFTGTPTAPTPPVNTNSTRLATTEFLFQQFSSNQSLSLNGYQRLPGGLIIQWGQVGSIGAGLNTAVTFPVTFPTGVLTIVSTVTDTNQYNVNAIAGTITVSGFTMRNSNTVTTTSSNWIALGY